MADVASPAIDSTLNQSTLAALPSGTLQSHTNEITTPSGSKRNRHEATTPSGGAMVQRARESAVVAIHDLVDTAVSAGLLAQAKLLNEVVLANRDLATAHSIPC